MLNKFKISGALLGLFMSIYSFAQETPKPSTEKKEEEIIIRKNGTKSEKMTIVVDGDNITIDGKPVDDFENKNVIIMRKNGPMPMKGPMVRKYYKKMNEGDLETEDVKGTGKPMLGVVTEKTTDGAKITDVTTGSGAEKAGLKEGDIITKIGSTKITDPQILAETIKSLKPQEKVDITYKRNGKESKTTATLGEGIVKSYSFKFDDKDFDFEMPEIPELREMQELREMPEMRNFNIQVNRRPAIGVQIQDVEEGKGVMIKDVEENSPASKAGLKEGDVIIQVNGDEIEDVDEMRKNIKELKEGDTLKINYKRNGSSQTTEIKIPKKLKTANL